MSVRWRFNSIYGEETEGTFEGFTDRGGTDVTYYIRDDTGRMHLVSGSRLQNAHPVPVKKEEDKC